MLEVTLNKFVFCSVAIGSHAEQRSRTACPVSL
jgi:hypothetical protein